MSITEPGVYQGVPIAEYRAIPAYGSGFLVDVLQRCPAYARYRADHDTEPTPAMVRGSALHALLLEPEVYAARYVEGASCARILSTGPRKGEPCGAESGAFYVVPDEPNSYEFLCGTHAKGAGSLIRDGRVALKRDAAKELRGMAAGVLAEADCLIGKACHVETTLVWRDEATGLLCKARPDFVCGDTIYDIKTRATRGAWNDAAFSRELANELLHVQAAHYIAGARANGLGVEHFRWVRVEVEPPHLASILGPLDDDSMAYAVNEVRGALATIADCVRWGKWPGYPQTGCARLPEWLLSGGPEVSFAGIEVEEEE